MSSFALFLVSSIVTLSLTHSPFAQALAARAPDACGPKVSQADDPKDTCSTKPLIAQTPETFGITVNTTTDSKTHAVDWATCDPLIAEICEDMFAPDMKMNIWTFRTTSPIQTDVTKPPCTMGFWIPAEPDRAKAAGTITSTGAASNPKDPQAQCKNIYRAMLDAAASQSPKSVLTSINLVEKPGTPPAPFRLPGSDEAVAAGSTALTLHLAEIGRAHNAGYPSYLLAYDEGDSPTSPSVSSTCQGKTPQGDPCDCDKDPNCSLMVCPNERADGTACDCSDLYPCDV
ncbi:hypothetical protein G7Y79_00004g012310 [Physcia stellaris]|nr:hypothetical protein G7Y79_00004g012310 [Physcia stellaris]